MNHEEQVGRVAMRRPVPIYTLKIGAERFPVDSLTHASILYQELRDASGCGASQWPAGSIEVEGITYRISYNGRVWDGQALFMEAA